LRDGWGENDHARSGEACCGKGGGESVDPTDGGRSAGEAAAPGATGVPRSWEKEADSGRITGLAMGVVMDGVWCATGVLLRAPELAPPAPQEYRVTSLIRKSPRAPRTTIEP